MPWQQHVADVAFELDPDTGRLVYREITIIVPRQQGKTSLIEAVALHRSLATTFFGSRQQIVYCAQTRNKAREKWEEDFCADLKAAPRLDGRFRIRRSNGSEHIRFENGSRWAIESNTEKAGHGGTLDLGFIDEAFAHADYRLEQAMKPAMVTRALAQLWVTSTAGEIGKSVYLLAKRDAGRAHVELGLDEGIAYFEWSAEDDADPADRAVWRATMPALGHTLTEATVAADFKSIPSRREFKRAYLCIWPKPGDDAPDVFGEGVWRSRIDVESEIDGPMAYGFDMSPNRAWCALGAVGRRPDGRVHYEVLTHAKGSGWALRRLIRLWDKWRLPIWIDRRSAAMSLVNALEKAGVDVRLMETRDTVTACGLVYDDVISGNARHLDQPELNGAVKVATRRELLDAWAWNKRGGDITPLVSLTNARHGLEQLEAADFDVLETVW